MPKVKTTYGKYMFPMKSDSSRSAKYGAKLQVNEPIRKQIDTVQPRQSMPNVMQYPPARNSMYEQPMMKSIKALTPETNPLLKRQNIRKMMGAENMTMPEYNTPPKYNQLPTNKYVSDKKK